MSLGLSLLVEPYVTLSSVKAEYSQHQLMLICSIYDFYPKKIKVTWLRDGKEITSDVTSTDELPNGNWLYQYHSNLEFTPKPGEKISCMVEHASLREPKIYNWGRKVCMRTEETFPLFCTQFVDGFSHVMHRGNSLTSY